VVFDVVDIELKKGIQKKAANYISGVTCTYDAFAEHVTRRSVIIKFNMTTLRRGSGGDASNGDGTGIFLVLV